MNRLIHKSTFLLLNLLFLLKFINAQVIDASTLNNKVMAGYQGWFMTSSDGSGAGWRHWSSGKPNPENITFDMWPDMRELDADELYETDFYYADNSNAGVYSAFNQKTVVRHLKWMKDYGIDGVFVQRFIGEAVGMTSVRDKVLQNVRAGAELHGRVFANMYDISGGNAATLVEDIKNDWMHLVDDLKILESANYLKHDGLPVLSIWGFGVGGREAFTPAMANEIIDWLTVSGPVKYRVTLKGGLTDGWQSHSQEWQNVYEQFDIISPWSVGRYGDNNGADRFRTEIIEPDIITTTAKGIDYMPVVFPGFSWWNLYNEKFNHIKRNGGDFFWHQAYNAIDAGCNMVYVAMFDEVDEGTAIFKVAENSDQIPTTGKFLTLDSEGTELPSDWYLRLTGEISKMLRKDISLSNSIPIIPYPDHAECTGINTEGTYIPDSVYTVSVTMKNTGTNTWSKANGYKLVSQSIDSNMVWGINKVELNNGENIVPGASKTFTFNIKAPADTGYYFFQWRMMIEGDRFFGDKTEKRVIIVGTQSNIFDDCDDLNDWNSSVNLLKNSTDKKEGSHCLEFNGSGTVEFQKIFAQSYNSGIEASNAALRFWYYVSDASLLSSNNQVEIGSANTSDADEYYWNLSGLVNGWNLITLKVNEAEKIGSPNLNNLNWFRLYSAKTGNVKSMIDEIQIVDIESNLMYNLSVNGGGGTGNYCKATQVNIAATEVPEGTRFQQWKIVSGNASIANINGQSTVLTMPAENVVVKAIFQDTIEYLDDCDALTDWKSSESLALNKSENQQGEGCIEFSGSSIDEFKKLFATAYNPNVVEATAKLEFDYYVSDLTALNAPNQVELGSGTKADVDEYSWSLSGLKQGWNKILLDISTAGKIGNPDINALNWFRIYHEKNSTLTTRIDAIKITGTKKPVYYNLTVNNGTGSGSVMSGSKVSISANGAAENMEFKTWIVDTGNAEIKDLNNANTTVVLYSGNATISPVYEKANKYELTVTNGSGAGLYKQNSEVKIIAEVAPQGKIFDQWILESGSAIINDAFNDTTTVTTTSENSAIKATYKDIVFYSLTVNNGLGSGSYEQGSLLNIIANEAPVGEIFDFWNIDAGNPLLDNVNNDTAILTMPAENVSVSALYKTKPSYLLTITNGTGNGSYFEGDTVEIVANSASKGMVFEKWIVESGNVEIFDSSAVSTKIVIKANNISLIAQYKQAVSYELTVLNGSGSGLYVERDTVNIVANAAPSGKIFYTWQITGDTNAVIFNDKLDSTQIIVPGSNITVAAIYVDNIFNLTVYGGSGSGNYMFNSQVFIKADSVPQGQQFSAWEILSGNGIVENLLADSTSLTLLNENMVIKARYEYIPYNLQVNSGKGTGIYNFSDTIKIIADTAKIGQVFNKWVINSGNAFIKNEFEDTTYVVMSDSDVSISASYSDIFYSLTVNGGKGSGNYYAGDTVVIVANEAPDGQLFSNWEIENGIPELLNSEKDSTVLIMPYGDVILSSVYIEIKIELKVGFGNGDGVFSPGTEVAIEADTNLVGKEFAYWTILYGNVVIADSLSLNTTVTVLNTNASIQAVYTDIEYILNVTNGLGSGTYIGGAEVAIKANKPEIGFEFKAWEVLLGEPLVADTQMTTTNLVMPFGNVEVRATYSKTQYAFIVGNGSGTGYYTYGDEVAIHAHIPEGKEFDKWNIDFGNVILESEDSVSTIATMNDNDAKVTATFKDLEISDTIITDTTQVSILQKEELLLYPNPTKGRIYLKSSAKQLQLNVYNLNGSLVFSENKIVVNETTFDLSSLTKGLYIVELKSDLKTERHKVLLQK